MDIKSRAELETHLARECLKNPALRQQLKDNPREVIEKVMGKKLPKEVKFNIVEEHGLDFTIVLPQESKEIEATLAGISGGVTGSSSSGGGTTSDYAFTPALFGLSTAANAKL